MTERKLILAYYGNGKSTNRYHIPFLIRRKDRIKVKTIYARTIKNEWDKWEGVNYTSNVNDLLNDREIDVVVITTPVEVRYQIAKQLIEAGKNLVLEKPFALSVEEAKDLFDLARKKGLMIQGYQNRRFDSDFLTSQKVIKSGKLGALTEVEMHYDYYRPEVPLKTNHYAKSESYIYNHACHTIDQVLYFFGKPEHISYDVRQILGEGRMNDYFDIDLYYYQNKGEYEISKGGLKVSVKSSYFRVKERPSFVLYGQKGMFIKSEKDKQESDLKKFYLPNHSDFGLDFPNNYGIISYYDENNKFHEEKVETVQGDNGIYYDYLYNTIINNAPVLVTEEETLLQMQILAEATKNLK